MRAPQLACRGATIGAGARSFMVCRWSAPMNKLPSIAAALAAFAAISAPAKAADLYDGDGPDGVVIEDDNGPVVVERERLIERRYYGPRAYVEEAPAVEVYEHAYRPAYYPDRRYYRAYDQW
jgi:hypothetical protein